MLHSHAIMLQAQTCDYFVVWMSFAGVDAYFVCRACETRLHSDDDYVCHGEQASIVLTDSGGQALICVFVHHCCWWS